MTPLNERAARAHPERAVLIGLLTLLEQTPVALGAVHRGGPASATADQARSLSQVCELLQLQVHAYLKLLTLEDKPR